MTSHELARKLLALPDLPVTVEDGSDPSDREEVLREPIVQNATKYPYFDRHAIVTEGQYIYVG